MVALAEQSDFAAKWPQEQYERILQSPSGVAVRTLVLIAEPLSLVAQQEPPIAGFLVARGIASDWELENIVVASAFRRQGIANQMLRECILRVRLMEGKTIFLEVRSANLAARTLYEKLGFHWDGDRRDYYSAPADAAALYRLDLL
jgi:ribosomal protein S18 acetylase RimI-like enzyme